MRAESLNVGRRIAFVVAPLLLVLSACGSEDVGDAPSSGTGATSGVGAAAAGGAAGVDTAGTRVNTTPSGSVVAPAGADTASKTKGTRP